MKWIRGQEMVAEVENVKEVTYGSLYYYYPS